MSFKQAAEFWGEASLLSYSHVCVFSLITTPTIAKLISYPENSRVPGQAVAAAYFIHSTAQFLGIILSLTQQIIQLNLT